MRERVRIKGRKGVFLVVGVDRERQVVDLISTTTGGHVEEDIPFASIERMDDAPASRRDSGKDKP
ncbi:MAG: hypothetical protein WAL73_00080 [Terracidiphilus sp.]